MKRREDDLKNRESLPSTAETNASEAAKLELPIDLDEILAAAIFDSVLRVKGRKFRNRSARRK
jgi:hypothetical protein